MTDHDWREPPRNWAEEQAHRIALEIRRLRGKRSAQWLADRTSELGSPVSRSVISDLEVGRRRHIAVAELVVIARALDTPASLLCSEIGWDDGTRPLRTDLPVRVESGHVWIGETEFPWPIMEDGVQVNMVTSRRNTLTLTIPCGEVSITRKPRP